MILDSLITKTASFVLNALGVPSGSSISTHQTHSPLTESLTKTPSDYTGSAFLDTKYSFAYVMSVVDSFRSGQYLVSLPDIDSSTKEFTFNSYNSVNVTFNQNVDEGSVKTIDLVEESKSKFLIGLSETSSALDIDETGEKEQEDYNLVRESLVPKADSILSFDTWITELQSRYKDILTTKQNRGFLNVSTIDSKDGDKRPPGQRGQDIGYDLGTMYILGMTHPGKTFGGFSSGFTLGGTIDSGTGPTGKVLGIRDFRGPSGPGAGASWHIGGISGSFTGGYFALLVGEVGPTGGAGATSYVVGATLDSSIFSGAVGGTSKIGYIYNLNDSTIGGAKESILSIISPLVGLAPIGITVGNTGGAGALVEGAHQIREYDQYSLRITELLDEFTSTHDRYDLVAGFSSGVGNTYTYETPLQVGDGNNTSPFGPYTNAIRLSPNTGQTGGASELQELAYYMIHELPAKRTEFDLHVKSLMTAGSEIDTLYKLSEWGIPETFKRLYEQ